MKDMTIDNIVKQLDELRIVKGISKADLCKLINITPVGYWRIMQGKQHIEGRTLALWAQIMGYKLSLTLESVT